MPSGIEVDVNAREARPNYAWHSSLRSESRPWRLLLGLRKGKMICKDEILRPSYQVGAEAQIRFNVPMLLSDHHISIILLAAGRGTRMSMGATSKLLLPMRDGLPIVRHAAESAIELGPEELIVVVRPDLPAIEVALSGLAARCVANPRFMEGMGTSLAVGAQSVGEGNRSDSSDAW